MPVTSVQGDPIGTTSDDRFTESHGVAPIGLKCNHGPPLHGPCSESVAIPAAGAYSGTLTLPSGTGTLAISTSISGLSYAPGIQATPILEITLTAKSAVLLNGRPAFAIRVPKTLSGSVSLAQSNPWTKIAGPVAVTNTGVAFSAAQERITIASGKSVTFALYGGSPSSMHSATVSGTVVDFAENTPLAGVKVSIAPYLASAPASQVATTLANGTFSFTAAPGTYFLIIGSDLPTDSRTTLHKKLILTSGANALSLPIPAAPANVVLAPSQLSGNFRLTQQTEQEQSCIDGANQGRVGALRPFVADEFLVEHAVAMNQEEFAQNTDTPTPLFFDGGNFFFSLGMPQDENTAAVAAAMKTGDAGGETTLGGTVSPFPFYVYAAGQAPPDYAPTYDGVLFFACSNWTGVTYSYVAGNPPYLLDTSPANIYYGGDHQAFLTASTQGQFGDQAWESDPRPPASPRPLPVSSFTPVTRPVPVATPTPGPIVLTVSAGTNVTVNEPMSPASTDSSVWLGQVAPATSQTTTITASESGYNGAFFVMYSPVNCTPVDPSGNPYPDAISINQTSPTTWVANSSPLANGGGGSCEMYVRNANPGTDVGLLSQEASLSVLYAYPNGPQSVARQQSVSRHVAPQTLTSKLVPRR